MEKIVNTQAHITRGRAHQEDQEPSSDNQSDDVWADSPLPLDSDVEFGHGPALSEDFNIRMMETNYLAGFKWALDMAQGHGPGDHIGLVEEEGRYPGFPEYIMDIMTGTESETSLMSAAPTFVLVVAYLQKMIIFWTSCTLGNPNFVARPFDINNMLGSFVSVDAHDMVDGPEDRKFLFAFWEACYDGHQEGAKIHIYARKLWMSITQELYVAQFGGHPVKSAIKKIRGRATTRFYRLTMARSLLTISGIANDKNFY